MVNYIFLKYILTKTNLPVHFHMVVTRNILELITMDIWFLDFEKTVYKNGADGVTESSSNLLLENFIFAKFSKEMSQVSYRRRQNVFRWKFASKSKNTRSLSEPCRWNC
jgi:hypothetical protein